MWWHSVFHSTSTAADEKGKNSLFIRLLAVTRRLEIKLISEQKVENIFVARHIANAMLQAVRCQPFIISFCL
jgi:hypothetical protein